MIRSQRPSEVAVFLSHHQFEAREMLLLDVTTVVDRGVIVLNFCVEIETCFENDCAVGCYLW